MVTSQEFKKRLRKATTENVKTIQVFLESEGVVPYEKIANVIGKSEKDTGRAIGGILSALSRTIIDGEPLIIPLGPSGDPNSNRRLLWKINPKIIETNEQRQELKRAAEEVLEERA